MEGNLPLSSCSEPYLLPLEKTNLISYEKLAFKNEVELKQNSSLLLLEIERFYFHDGSSLNLLLHLFALLISSLIHIRLSDCVDLLEDMEQKGVLDMDKVGPVI